jgi:N-acetylmuramoyl-L-alanine amidase
LRSEPVPTDRQIIIPSPHYSTRTKGITAIVLHYTGAMTIEGMISWFKDPVSKVSAHYLIGRDGRLVQMVPDNRVAWHAGRSAMRPHLADGDPRKEINVNSFSLGIELVATHDSGFEKAQLNTLYTLLELLISKYKIAPERVVGHADIAPGRKIDPDGYHKQFDWEACRRVVTAAYNAAVGATAPLTGEQQT